MDSHLSFDPHHPLLPIQSAFRRPESPEATFRLNPPLSHTTTLPEPPMIRYQALLRPLKTCWESMAPPAVLRRLTSRLEELPLSPSSDPSPEDLRLWLWFCGFVDLWFSVVRRINKHSAANQRDAVRKRERGGEGRGGEVCCIRIGGGGGGG